MSDAQQGPSTDPTEAATTNPEPVAAESSNPTARRSSVVPVLAALAVGAFVGGVSGAGVSIWATSLNTGSPTTNTGAPTTITVNDADDATLVTAVAAKASPSVVTIAVASSSAAGTGSGVILDSDGHILTNNHVITLDGAVSEPEVTVTTNDGRLLAATIVGTDPISDLAVIKVDAEGLQPAEFADSDNLNVGDRAIAIGAPLGLAGTVTDGIVSALNRSITVASSALPEEDGTAPEEQPSSPYDFFNFDLPGQSGSQATSTISLAVIQTDAAINPGNSGGALLDSEGRVIGINVAIASAGNGGAAGSIGVGFAIPSNIAQRIAGELIDGDGATHGLLGATVADVQDDENQSGAGVVGASIVELTPGGAAEAAGLRVGDIITGFNGIPITGKTDLTAQVRAVAAGASAELGYVRDGRAATINLTLGTLQ
jgi:putative serine protease PepD